MNWEFAKRVEHGVGEKVFNATACRLVENESHRALFGGVLIDQHHRLMELATSKAGIGQQQLTVEVG